MSRAFANGPEDRGSISGRVIPKTQKMVLDASLLDTQHYKVEIKGKVEVLILEVVFVISLVVIVSIEYRIRIAACKLLALNKNA